MIRALTSAVLLALGLAIPASALADDGSWHTDVLAYTFHVGEVNGSGPNDTQEISAYDPNWMANYGGCDGIRDRHGICQFEQRDASNGYFPGYMVPNQNPFYLDLPVSDPEL